MANEPLRQALERARERLVRIRDESDDLAKGIAELGIRECDAALAGKEPPRLYGEAWCRSAPAREVE